MNCHKQGHARHLVIVFTMALAQACSSGGSSSSGSGDPDATQATPSYRLSTSFQGVGRPLGVVDGVPLLVNEAGASHQRWEISDASSGFLRLKNVQVGDGQSLDIVNDGVFDKVVLADTAAVSGQQWLITPLDNGFCKLTTAFLGEELALDIVNDDADSSLRMAAAEDVSGQSWRIDLVSGEASADVPLCTGEPATATDSLPTSSYRSIDMSGFTVLMHPDVDSDPTMRSAVVARMESSIAAIDEALDGSRRESLRQAVIWIEAHSAEAGVARFHPSADWLVQNGLNPDKAGAIEIRSASGFVDLVDGPQPWVLMHELAHAYAFNQEGLNEQIQIAYDAAIDAGLYDEVETAAGGLAQAYAATNVAEYFAELTEAYLGLNDFFPFTRDELLVYDVLGYALMQIVWG